MCVCVLSTAVSNMFISADLTGIIVAGNSIRPPNTSGNVYQRLADIQLGAIVPVVN